MADWSRFDPDWTEQEYKAGGARDDLGIETLSEAILADLLPGINNQTRRARYYSFWAWALKGFIDDPDANPHTQNKFWIWLRGREDTLILAYLAHGCGGGLAGTTIGARIWGDGPPMVYDITWKSLESVEGGSYQLYYRGALEEMNIIVRNGESLHDDLSREVGAGLAEAFGIAVSSSRFVQHHLQATQLSREDIVDFAQTGCICRIGDNELERQRLVKAFFRFDTPDAFAVKRLASLCFFLDVIEQSQGLPLKETDFRTVLYFWSYTAQHAYLPKGNCIEPAQRWRIFQLRQVFVFAVEAFWSLFLHFIQSESLTGNQYLGWLVNELDLQALSAHWGFVLPDTDPSRLRLKDFYNSIHAALPDGAWSNGTTALDQTLNEQALIDTIRADRSNLNAQAMAGSGLLALALIYWRSLLWQGTSGWQYLSDRFALGRMPLDSYLRQVEYAFEVNWSVTDWLSWLHKNYLWMQHRRVALEKLITRKQEVYKFELLVDEPETSLEDEQHRFRGLGIDVPKMNAPRFPSALNILTDLRLITIDQASYRLTPEGASLLAAFRNYQVPKWKEAENDQVTELTEETSS